MSRKKPTATQRLRSNMQRQIRRMESKGYTIPTEIKEKVKTAKYQTLKSLQKDKYKKLYKESSAKIQGETVSGYERKKYVAQVGREKAQSTRLVNQVRKEIQQKKEANQKAIIEAEREIKEALEFEKNRKKKDKIDRKIAEGTGTGEGGFYEGDMILNRVEKLIEEYPTKGAKKLEQELTRQIGKYGRENVARSFANSPTNVIQLAQEIIYYEESSDEVSSAFREFYDLITGEIEDTETNKELSDIYDELNSYE